MIVDKLFHGREVGVAAAKGGARHVKGSAMALGAALADIGLLAGRHLCRQWYAPGSRFSHLGQVDEIGGEAGDLCIAELAFNKGGHHASRLAHFLLELRGG